MVEKEYKKVEAPKGKKMSKKDLLLILVSCLLMASTAFVSGMTFSASGLDPLITVDRTPPGFPEIEQSQIIEVEDVSLGFLAIEESIFSQLPKGPGTMTVATSPGGDHFILIFGPPIE